MRRLSKILLSLVLLVFIVIVAGGGTVLWGVWKYGKDLPDYGQLADYQPPTSTRVHAGDGRLLAEYAIEKRVFVPARAIPTRVKNAFIAAEDQNFYHHYGVDPVALTRAVFTNVKLYLEGRRPIGASTITQQVAKNFLLSNELSITRKIKEAILALRIERALSKERILELYLNEIYLGYGSYGVAAAALNYFDKSLDELTVAEAAYIAALPKAPNNYHPLRKRDAAIGRRNWVVERMLEEGFIDTETAIAATNEPFEVKKRSSIDFVDAGYFLEEVRRELEDRFGRSGLYEGGLSVRTTLDPMLQSYAREALRGGLMDYDRRHGWRGPVTHLEADEGWESDWQEKLEKVETPPGNLDWRMAAVIAVSEEEARIGFKDGSEGRIPLVEVTWAREHLDNEHQTRGAAVKKIADVMVPGDVVLVEEVREGPPKTDDGPPREYPPGTYSLRQIPKVNGAIVAMDPHTGRVLAMSGGWSFETSQFNRATQAERQPGSAFKPFVYLTALENGYTPATIILDAPFVIDQGAGLGKWKPANFSNKFYGPSPMRLGIEKSRNLMTVRLAQAVGMERISDTAERFGIKEDMPAQLAMALGSASVKLIDMVTAYSGLVNGGKKVEPALIDRVQDRIGRTIFKHDTRECANCNALYWNDQPLPDLPDVRPQITDPGSAYQIVTMLEGVVQRGTGRRIASLGKPLGGKTGTTNDSKDTWFIGFSPDLAVGVFVGFDTPKPLGRRPWGGQETGSSVAAPIFKSFMAKALENEPAIPFRTPPEIRMVRIDAERGTLATPASEKVITEAFKPGTAPSENDGGVLITGGTLARSDNTGTDGSGDNNTSVPNAGVNSGGRDSNSVPEGLY